ncbi:uncharacterized protein LOC118217104 [Anguilla anguilla]|uniref:uncharacterized protein LOC118217104 n=1 Tax=Anguilla anguilla TaxID=7936 RepID=UPI0015B33061|nr:uncharacterized protein LOC118217104 [Anguilla anguilla]XP_035254802.1 uncharacterized protein LOC118217104 [Anguilla anguilla]XP_035254803.1 uncharacterized protein LOC118217104 [Anguilla anguilla]
MEAEGCTVTVSGLPTGIDEERLVDKLCIHFLRGRHGGGEISSINITKTTPASALITFEDRKVAQSVVQYGKHILLLDNKEYKLTVSFPSKEVNQDKVFTSMTVIVNYNWLPLGKEVVTRVQRSSPEIQCGFDLPAGLCTLSGRFSVVQAIVSQLLGLLESPASLGTSLAGTRGSTGRKSTGSSAVRDPSSGSQGLGQASPETLEGSSGTNRIRAARADPLRQDYDRSLIVDIDAFRYLQKHCGQKYERILSRRGVEALDVTTDGVTTLFLQTTEGQASGHEGLRQAHRDLSRLCQEVESRLCREQLLKESGPQEGLQQALEALQLQLPQVLLGQDAAGKHISIVGSSSDVMEAKRFLLDLRAEEVARLLPRLGRADLGPASNASRLDASAGTVLKTCMDGSPEGGREYRLAASFRDTKCRVSGLDKLGIGLGNTLLTPRNAFKELSSVRKQRSSMNSSGPVLSSGRISGKERPGVGVGGLNLEDLRKFGTTGQDIPLEKLDPVSAASVESRPLLSSTLTDLRLQVGSSLGTVQHMDLFGVQTAQTADVPPSQSGFTTTLRRANSFSGYARNRRDQKVGDAGGYEEKLSRGKLSTPGISKEQQEVHSVEVQAHTVMWQYMKEVYCTRLEDIISGSQVKESQSDSDVTTIILKGAEPSRVNGCQRELRNLVTMVATDFTVEELPLVRLGVADPQDETLEICCAEVRSRFRKVKIQLHEDILFVIGPRQLCAQVVGALLEVFQDGAKRRQGLRESPRGVGGSSDTSLTTSAQDKKNLPPQSDNLDQSSCTPDGSQEEPVTQTGEETRPSTSEHKQNVQKVSGGGAQQVSQSAAQKEPIIMEKLGKARPKNGKPSKVNAALFTHPASASTRKETVITSTGTVSQSGPGSPHSGSKDQKDQSRPEAGPSQDQD